MKKNFYWSLILICCACISCTSSTHNDEESIKRLLEKESATWRSGDLKAHAECWSIKPYSKILVSTPDGNCYDVNPNDIIHPKPEMLDKGGSSKNTNYKFSIHDNNAWVSHDEESIDAAGNKNYSYEIRMLEKINGEWKLVGQSIHLYKK